MQWWKGKTLEKLGEGFDGKWQKEIAVFLLGDLMQLKVGQEWVCRC
ncbi:MAG: hypothetical protein NZ781_12760 [Armatimonadetes bacterium]|nr:hypothetical protein [Armatimonadota bacterium]